MSPEHIAVQLIKATIVVAPTFAILLMAYNLWLEDNVFSGAVLFQTVLLFTGTYAFLMGWRAIEAGIPLSLISAIVVAILVINISLGTHFQRLRWLFKFEDNQLQEYNDSNRFDSIWIRAIYLGPIIFGIFLVFWSILSSVSAASLSLSLVASTFIGIGIHWVVRFVALLLASLSEVLETRH